MNNLSARNRWTAPPPRAEWLPAGKTATVLFSVDDVHPLTRRESDGAEAAADGLERLIELQRAHPRLKATLGVTPDWRLASRLADSKLRHLPFLKQRVHWTRLEPEGRNRLDRHPAFVSRVNGLSRCEVVLNGLTHAHPGPNFAVEFQNESEAQCEAIVRRGIEIFETAGLKFVKGYLPPGWNAPPPLLAALARLDFEFVSSARDIHTTVVPEAVATMSGLQGASLIYPDVLDGDVVHLTCNFQATSPFERAVNILELGGVLHIRAHLYESGDGPVPQNSLDRVFAHYIDRLLVFLDRRFGESLWYAHLSEVASRVRAVARGESLDALHSLQPPSPPASTEPPGSPEQPMVGIAIGEARAARPQEVAREGELSRQARNMDHVPASSGAAPNNLRARSRKGSRRKKSPTSPDSRLSSQNEAEHSAQV